MESMPSALEAAARPLLHVVQHITRMETSFITSIDWDAQSQDVLFSLNTGTLQIPEKSVTAWSDSMCRAMFLAGQAASSDVGGDVPATRNAVQSSLKSFVAVPILVDDRPIGTVCGASHGEIELDAAQVDALQHIADALQQLLQAEHDKQMALERANLAEAAVRKARDAACQQAVEFQRMTRLAHTDELTGLPNRRAFMTRLEDALARSARRRHGIGVILIDADRFKIVNDTMGHLVGDQVLGAIATALRQVARTPDLVARLGGDEFAMAVSNAEGEHLLATAEQILQRFMEAVAPLGVDATLSIGLAHSDATSRHRLLGDADRALYRSKAAGGGRVTAFALETA
jgi:diguanylate cyclase